MKQMKKLTSLLLALIMAFAMTTTALAAESYSITVKNGNTAVSINGNTYSAYKLFDVTYNEGKTSYAYTISEEFKDFTYTVGTGESAKSYSGEALINYVAEQASNSDEMNAIAEAVLKYAVDNGIQAAGTAVASDGTARINLSAPGYYLVAGTATAPDNQTVTAACSLTTTDPTAEITVKVDAPSIDKKIDEGKNTGVYEEDDVKKNEGSIGNKVPYIIHSTVPNMVGYEKYYFVVNDTLSKGLTFNDDVVIKIGEKTLTKNTDYTVVTGTDDAGNTTIEIVFKNFIQYKNAAGQDITITYSATINQNAVIGNAGNPNTVKLIYSNNPNVQDDGTPENPDKPTDKSPVGETPESETVTYVSGIQLTKVDNSTEAKKLTGAKFKIEGEKLNIVLVNKEIYRESETGTYYRLKDGTYTTDEPKDDTSKYYESTTVKYEKIIEVTKETQKQHISTEGWVDKDGVITFTGLGAGTYTITELIAPNGYNLLKEPITVTISWDGTAANDQYWTATKGTGENAEKLEMNGDNFHFAFNVVNQTGAELPTTGGMGTTIFYVIGSVLVLAAVVLLVTKKRMDTKK